MSVRVNIPAPDWAHHTLSDVLVDWRGVIQIRNHGGRGLFEGNALVRIYAADRAPVVPAYYLCHRRYPTADENPPPPFFLNTLLIQHLKQPLKFSIYDNYLRYACFVGAV